MDKLIGSQIKLLRKSRGMTLQDLAEKTQLSLSYLSMLERGLSSPTIANLQRICNVFNLMLPELLTSLNQNSLLVKKNERYLIFDDEKGVKYESLTNGKTNIIGTIMTVTDNNIHHSDVHSSDELGFIISGSINIKLNNNVYCLEEGDSFYIPANTYHCFEKTSEDECISIWVYISENRNER